MKLNKDIIKIIEDGIKYSNNEILKKDQYKFFDEMSLISCVFSSYMYNFCNLNFEDMNLINNNKKRKFKVLNKNNILIAIITLKFNFKHNNDPLNKYEFKNVTIIDIN